MEQLVARQAHNLEVARSNPASATTEPDSSRVSFVYGGFDRAPGRRSLTKVKAFASKRLRILPPQLRNPTVVGFLSFTEDSTVLPVDVL